MRKKVQFNFVIKQQRAFVNSFIYLLNLKDFFELRKKTYFTGSGRFEYEEFRQMLGHGNAQRGGLF